MDDRYCGYCDATVHPSHERCPDCGKSLLLNRRYRLHQLLGEGGSGVVYAAVDTTLHNRLCAIKRMRTNPDHEIKIFVEKASRFTFIPHVYDRWSDPPFHFYVMEYIGGETLDHVRPLPWRAEEVEGFLRTGLGYLVQLHSDGIIHRDLKPANIKYTPQGRATYMLLDFGIAKRIDQFTGSTHKAATRDFAPPEQLFGQPTDERADLYSLAATAYGLLTGRVARETIAFERDTLVPPGQLVEGVPPALELLLMQMLHLERDQRPASARDALAKLDTPNVPFPLPVPPVPLPPPPRPRLDVDPTTPVPRPVQPVPQRQFGKGSIISVGWAADGRSLVVASTLAAAIYDTKTLHEQRRIATSESRPGLCAHGSDRFASAIGPVVRVWQTSTGALIHTLHPQLADVVRVTLAPDGRAVAVASDQAVQVWRDGVLRPPPQGHFDGVSGLAISPDGETLATVSRTGVQLWRVEDGAQLGALPRAGARMTALAFAPDGQILASAAGTTVQVYRTSGMTLLYDQEGHTTPIVDLAFAPNGLTLASASHDAIKLWRARDGAPRRTLAGESIGLVSIAFAPDGRTLAAATGEHVRLWSVSDGTLLRTLHGYLADLQSIAISPDGQTLAVAGRSVQLWEIGAGTLLRVLEAQDAPANSLAFSPNGQILASASPERIKLWQTSDWTLRHTLDGRADQTSGLGFAADGRTLIAAASEAVQLWDVDTGIRRAMLNIDPAGLYAVALEVSGRTLAAVYERAIHLWRVDEGAPFYRLEIAGDINGVALARDGATLAVAMDDAVQVWRLHDGDEDQLSQLDHGAQQIVFSPNGALLASAWHTTVSVWDVTNRALLSAFEAHRDSVTTLAFTPDGQLLASAAQDGTVRLWKAREANDTLDQ